MRCSMPEALKLRLPKAKKKPKQKKKRERGRLGREANTAQKQRGRERSLDEGCSYLNSV